MCSFRDVTECILNARKCVERQKRGEHEHRIIGVGEFAFDAACTKLVGKSISRISVCLGKNGDLERLIRAKSISHSAQRIPKPHRTGKKSLQRLGDLSLQSRIERIQRLQDQIGGAG